MIPTTERRTLDEGEFWPDELVGLQARAPDGTNLGVVGEVIEGPAQYRLVIRSAELEFQVPFVDELVPEVDIESGYLIVVPIEGLTDSM